MSEQNNNSFALPGAIIIAGVIIAGAVIYSQNPSAGPEPTPNNDPLGEEQVLPGEFSADVEGWPSLGDANAPVTIVEYSDFACPFCARFHDETLPSIKKDYIDTGKVRFVYKDFPVVGGNKASEASHCAEEQGAYWEYHDLLFTSQTTDRTLWADVDVHRGYAETLGIDADALVECFNSGKYKEKIAQASQEAVKNGGEGTPYFLVNGVPVSGAQPYSVFQQAIDSSLEL